MMVWTRALIATAAFLVVVVVVVGAWACVWEWRRTRRVASELPECRWYDLTRPPP